MKRNDLIELQTQVIDIVKTIKVLDRISWPSSIEKKFFQGIAKGNRPILKFKYEKHDLSEESNALKKLLNSLSVEKATHVFIRESILSYLNAINMIHSIGSKSFEDLSIEEYGRPTHKLFGSEYSHLSTARTILESYHQFDHPYLSGNNEKFRGSDLKKYLKKESQKVFGELTPEFVLSSKMIPKAAAGRTRVRIRENVEFSSFDFDQLLVHEVMTHSLTAINGNLQKSLPLLALGSPRTTKTQEGLATFSEVITGNMDLHRLKRIALRVIAIDMALNGADLYDLYQFFIDNDQSQGESYLSATRILRGGFAGGGIVFTKDGVYLEGLIRVHSFFRWAFKTRNLDLVHLLFCGRLDINDIFLLREEYKSGTINPPSFLPKWYQDIDLLAGKLAFSLVLNGINLQSVEEHYINKGFKLSA
ncbi:MAG: flavohemoglobin expression-modulating QEGLA motif protein [Bacteriovoracaceae bacterium]|nr:flavohemoglobin expression-modulating QEGLA motif protein [Bacteriovoracaceae bacterium]